jgi:hypothetical protein
MSASDRWLIACDLDGTLFDHSLRISSRVRATLAAAQQAGHAVTLATGRMYRATLPFATELAIDQPLICYQGALVRRGDDEIFHLTLPLSITRDAVSFALEHGIHLNAYVDDRLFTAQRTPEAEFYVSLNPAVELELVGDLQSFLTHEPTKLVFIRDEAATERLLPIAVERWGEQAQVVRSHARFVELTHRDASKGSALLHLAKALEIPRERTLAIGDNLNDLSMLREAGVGVAMGNALPTLKIAADWVAPPLSEDGVAAAIERFVLEGHRD